MLALVVAGEAIFIPPFHPARYFKTSLLDTLGINFDQLGQAQAYYGWVAMACYVVGGPLADRVAPRTLIALSLLATGAGSLYLATFPGLFGLKLLFAFWGASTILGFWAPLLRATREWGGDLAQGRAFGLLDSGRGLVGAMVASGSALALASFATESGAMAGEDGVAALRGILYSYVGCCAVAALVVWLFVPVTTLEKRPTHQRSSAVELATLFRLPAIWLNALVIVAAYSAFKSFEYYGTYSEEACGLSEVGSAKLTAYSSYLRVVAGIGAGWIADRWLGVSGTLAVCFAALAASYGLFFALPSTGATLPIVVANIVLGSTMMYALRGVYFALLEEASIPRNLTGAAIGVVSFLGFTPEIFMPRLGGWLIQRGLDAGEPLSGYQTLWAVLAGFAAVGFAAAIALRTICERSIHLPEPANDSADAP